MRQKIEIEIETPAGECTPTIYLPKEIIGNGFRFAFATEPAQPQPEPWKRWRATEQEAFYQVGKHGDIEKNVECLIDWDDNAYANGNYFRTQALAERHAKRLRSMVPTCAMPKKGEKYYYAYVDGDGFVVDDDIWQGSKEDICSFYEGIVKLTKEAAEAWIAEFGGVWTTRVEGEGE